MFNRRRRSQQFQPSFLMLAHRVLPSSGATDPLVSVTPICVETVDVASSGNLGVSNTPIFIDYRTSVTATPVLNTQIATAR